MICIRCFIAYPEVRAIPGWPEVIKMGKDKVTCHFVSSVLLQFCSVCWPLSRYVNLILNMHLNVNGRLPITNPTFRHTIVEKVYIVGVKTKTNFIFLNFKVKLLKRTQQNI